MHTRKRYELKSTVRSLKSVDPSTNQPELESPTFTLELKDDGGTLQVVFVSEDTIRVHTIARTSQKLGTDNHNEDEFFWINRIPHTFTASVTRKHGDDWRINYDSYIRYRSDDLAGCGDPTENAKSRIQDVIVGAALIAKDQSFESLEAARKVNVRNQIKRNVAQIAKLHTEATELEMKNKELENELKS